MQMKKETIALKHTKCLIALLLGLCLLLGLTACTSSTPADTETPAAASDAETTASETTEETEEAAEPEAGEETETPTDFGILTDIAGENGTTYANLFTVILDSQYDDLWLSKAAAIVGEDAAQENVDYLKGFISADIYGEEAVEAYKDAGYFMFDCWYLADVDTFTFDGDTVTTKLTDGSEPDPYLRISRQLSARRRRDDDLRRRDV